MNKEEHIEVMKRLTRQLRTQGERIEELEEQVDLLSTCHLTRLRQLEAIRMWVEAIPPAPIDGSPGVTVDLGELRRLVRREDP